jgi:hypothetical protein
LIGASHCLQRSYEPNSEAVVSLRTNRLDCGRAHARLGGKQLVEAPYAGRYPTIAEIRALGGGVEDGAGTHYVVTDDQRSHTLELERPLQVARVVLLVGVDEDHVEGPGSFVVQLRQGLQRVAHANLHHVVKAGV